MPIEPAQANLTESLIEWLSSEGYVLEYKTLHALRAAGMNATMGFHINSRDGVPREIDVTSLAVAAKNQDAQCLYVIRLICECKYTAEKPWVILQSGLASGLPQDWQSLPHSKGIDEVGTILSRNPRFAEGLWHFAPRQHVGHTITQAFRKDNRDHAFSSLQKVANAAWDWVLLDGHNGTSVNLICIPAIVLQGDLFEAWCPKGNDRFEVRQVPYGRLAWTGAQNGTMIDVVTQSGLDAWAKMVSKTVAGLFDVCGAKPLHAEEYQRALAAET
jgi:hypothetical protein